MKAVVVEAGEGPSRRRRVPRAERRHAALQPRGDRDPAAPRRAADPPARGRGRLLLHPRRRADLHRRGRGGRGGPGTFVLVPPGLQHTFRNDGDESCAWSTCMHRPGSTSGSNRTSSYDVPESSSRRTQDRPLRRPAGQYARHPLGGRWQKPRTHPQPEGLGSRARRRLPRGHAAPRGVRLALLRPGSSTGSQPQAHFVIFGAVGAIAFALGYAAGEAATAAATRVLLLSLAFMATGGFMGLHAFGTVGVLFSESRAGFQVAIPVGLLVAPSSPRAPRSWTASPSRALGDAPPGAPRRRPDRRHVVRLDPGRSAPLAGTEQRGRDRGRARRLRDRRDRDLRDQRRATGSSSAS